MTEEALLVRRPGLNVKAVLPTEVSGEFDPHSNQHPGEMAQVQLVDGYPQGIGMASRRILQEIADGRHRQMPPRIHIIGPHRINPGPDL